LKPAQSKGTKAGGNEKEKNTKDTDGDKKNWKARFVELEAKMVAMSATTNSGGPKPHDTPSFHAGGGSLPDDKEFERFMLSGMAITTADLTLEAFAHTQSQTAAPKEAPHSVSPNLDPQHGEGNKQARLLESFTLGEVGHASTLSKTPKNEESNCLHCSFSPYHIHCPASTWLMPHPWPWWNEFQFY
jgi:hypothetical protein